MKYTVNNDFTAKEFFFNKASIPIKSKSFKKGDIIDGGERVDMGLNKHIVSFDGFDIPTYQVTAYVAPIGSGGVIPPAKKEVTVSNNTSTTQNVLTENQKSRIGNLEVIQYSAATLGSIAGAVYAGRTGGGFWRYAGYWVAGGVAFGLVSALAIVPFKNKILKEGDSNVNTK